MLGSGAGNFNVVTGPDGSQLVFDQNNNLVNIIDGGPTTVLQTVSDEDIVNSINGGDGATTVLTTATEQDMLGSNSGNFNIVTGPDGSELVFDENDNLVNIIDNKPTTVLQTATEQDMLTNTVTTTPTTNTVTTTPTTNTVTTTPPTDSASTKNPLAGLLGLMSAFGGPAGLQGRQDTSGPFYSPRVEYVDVDKPFQIVGLGQPQNQQQQQKPLRIASGGYIDELLALLEQRK
jgi:hypothetical protein